MRLSVLGIKLSFYFHGLSQNRPLFCHLTCSVFVRYHRFMILNDTPQNARYLFLDMNCFFARVEQQVQPIYRGQPVCVTPYTGDSGCVIAASYEAKAVGIKGGCRVADARKIYPKVVILPSRPHLYMIYHKEIIKIAEKFSPFIKIMSIDEFSIRLTGRDANHDAAVKMAMALKAAIQKEVGDWLTCSIGIGPNQFLAKMAGEMKKPDGLFEIKLENLAEIYEKLELRDLTGINFRMERRFNYANIYTPSDFFAKSMSELSKNFGILGKAWFYRLRGYEVEEITRDTKTIGHSHVLPPELRSQKGAQKTIVKLVEKTGYRLRKDNFWATQIFLGISYSRHVHWHKAKRIAPCQDNQQLINQTLEMFRQAPDGYPFAIQFATSGLIKNHIKTISLFDDLQKPQDLSKAMDKINDKFGASTIHSASFENEESIAPDRISFGRPRFDIQNF